MVRSACVLLLLLVASVRAAMEGFIVGGENANIYHHPHSAFLNIHCMTDYGKKPAWICGASIVNQNILLTAGHCLAGCSYESHITANLGDEHRQRGRTYSTYSFLIHEDYNPTTSSNDICLLRVAPSLTLNNKISRVALMRKPPYSEKAKVAGWGMIDELLEKQSDWLKYVTQKVRSRDDCLRIFGYLPTGTFCAASTISDDEYASQGDSGSALIIRGYIQIGLVSYKIPSLSRNVVVYTDVGFFYDWIKIHSKRLVCIQ